MISCDISDYKTFMFIPVICSHGWNLLRPKTNPFSVQQMYSCEVISALKLPILDTILSIALDGLALLGDE